MSNCNPQDKFMATPQVVTRCLGMRLLHSVAFIEFKKLKTQIIALWADYAELQHAFSTCVCFLHAFAFSMNLRWFESINVKTQNHAVNACWKRNSQHALIWQNILEIIVMHIQLYIFEPMTLQSVFKKKTIIKILLVWRRP